MTSTSIRRAIVPGVAALALFMSACGAGNEKDIDAGTDAGGGTAALSGTLTGGGSSAQEKAQAAWVAGVQDANPDLTVNYEPVGSGDGRANFISGGYAFAGTDSAIKDDELTKATATCGDEAPIQVPGYVSPIAVVYNVPGVDKLQLDPKTIADIFAGKIKKWNDPAIAATNDGVKLPDTTIAPVHRSDDSGTQENFTAYLAAAGGWSAEPDGVWPNGLGGEGADGTSGVVGVIQGGKGTIGFVDDSAALANKLDRVSVKVGEEYVEPSADAAAKILSISKPAGLSDNDLAVDLARDTTEAGVYPIVLVSYLLACKTYDDAATGKLVKGYLSYVLSADGQAAAAQEAGSAPLPTETADKALALVETIK